jgi:hypothetical protein
VSQDREGGGPHGHQGGDRGHGGGGPPGHGGGERRGPPDTSFLDLEMSKVMYAEAQQLAREAGRELVREAIKARLRERLGPEIEAIARIAADEMADDLLANLDIEARIDDRRRARQGLEGRVLEALRKK